MSKMTYLLLSETIDGTVHDIGQVMLIKNQRVGTETKSLDTDELRKRRMRSLSALCRVHMSAAPDFCSLQFTNQQDS